MSFSDPAIHWELSFKVFDFSWHLAAFAKVAALRDSFRPNNHDELLFEIAFNRLLCWPANDVGNPDDKSATIAFPNVIPCRRLYGSGHNGCVLINDFNTCSNITRHWFFVTFVSKLGKKNQFWDLIAVCVCFRWDSTPLWTIESFIFNRGISNHTDF
jgi:hypothetical protein